MKVTVDQAFWDLFPTARITVMSLYGIDNTVDEAKDPYFLSLIHIQMCIRDRLKIVTHVENAGSQKVALKAGFRLFRQFKGSDRYTRKMRAVSYTHLDVYKRQNYSCNDLKICFIRTYDLIVH